MKRKKSYVICCTVCLLCLLLASCRSHGLLSDDFDAGDTVTPEELLEISRELFTETSEPASDRLTTEEASQAAETLPLGATVYWLDGGSVYHAARDCRHISHAEAEDIREGTVSKALAEGKERLCSSCAP